MTSSINVRSQQSLDIDWNLRRSPGKRYVKHSECVNLFSVIRLSWDLKLMEVFAEIIRSVSVWWDSDTLVVIRMFGLLKVLIGMTCINLLLHCWEFLWINDLTKFSSYLMGRAWNVLVGVNNLCEPTEIEEKWLCVKLYKGF